MTRRRPWRLLPRALRLPEPLEAVELGAGCNLYVPASEAPAVRAQLAASSRQVPVAPGRPVFTALLDGITGERRRTRARVFDGPTLRVRRRRDLINGDMLPGWVWSVWHGCYLTDAGEVGPGEHARALVLGDAALNVAIARARGEAAADDLWLTDRPR